MNKYRTFTVLLLGIALGASIVAMNQAQARSGAHHILKENNGFLRYEPNETIYMVPQDVNPDVFRALHTLSKATDDEGRKHTLISF